MNYYVLITIIVLAVIYILLLLSGKIKRQKKFTTWSLLALIFIVFGILAGAAINESRVFTYSLFGFGVMFAAFDIFLKPKK